MSTKCSRLENETASRVAAYAPIKAIAMEARRRERVQSAETISTTTARTVANGSSALMVDSLSERGLRGCAKAAVAGAELGDSGVQVRGVEVRPHARGEDQLGVGGFPEQKIAEALLAAGSNDQVDFGPEQCGEIVARCIMGKAARGFEDGIAAGIIDGESEMQARAGGGGRFGAFDDGEEQARKTVAAADDGDAHTVLDAAVALPAQVMMGEAHQSLDLGGAGGH